MGKWTLRYLGKWAAIIAAGEAACLPTAASAAAACIAGGLAFGVAVGLRLSGRYPGHPEPLVLDLWGALCGLALGAGFAAGWAPFGPLRPLGPLSPLAVRALAPPLTVLPHVIYILRTPDLPRPGSRRRP